MKKYPLARKSDLVVQGLDNEILIYDLTENKAFCLNETSAMVWQLCDGNKTVAEISQALGQKLNSPANEDLVWFAIDQLKKENLIENEAALGNHFAGMSRREVVKKVGLGTMIALPFIASLVAPEAVLAGLSVPAAPGAVCSCPNGQAMNATTCTNSVPACTSGTCTGVMCNGGGNSCGSGTCA